ncbi:GL25210 [Drosophila persimilis]|uniref:GL25210 n=1 Tax=Drosophila persimilis TaxID=7234 RepID=B4GRI7_DROPE|nr:protein BFR2 [Drosophila persimilis]EDW40372.1 GL25210 [Drosophila persimilis]
MQSNKVLFLVFGVLALVIAASLSSEAVEQDSEGISDRRYRWASEEDNSEDSEDSADAEDDEDQGDQDDQGNNSDEDDQGNNSDEDGEWEEEIIEYVPAGESWEDLENGSDEA